MKSCNAFKQTINKESISDETIKAWQMVQYQVNFIDRLNTNTYFAKIISGLSPRYNHFLDGNSKLDQIIYCKFGDMSTLQDNN